jgi:pimeloyl-ACP methyl ester carboxylesterase
MHSNDWYVADMHQAGRSATWICINRRNGIKMPVYVYLPSSPSSCEHALIAIHGVGRRAKNRRDIFIDYIKDQNILLISPEFSDSALRDNAALNLGNMFTTNTAEIMNQKQDWTFQYIEDLFLLFRQQFHNLSRYSIFGHSAGGQFAHRFAIFFPSSFLHKTIVANAGWYTFLDSRQQFPYSVAGMLDDTEIAAALAREVCILAGDNDVNQDRHLRLTHGAMTQGVNRFDRAKNFYRTAAAKAAELDVDFNWKLKILPDVGHSAQSLASDVMDELKQ